MKEIKSMCETCHQPNQGGEGIEHDKGCPESDEQLTTNDNMKTKITSYYIDDKNTLHTYINEKKHITISNVKNDKDAERLIKEED